MSETRLRIAAIHFLNPAPLMWDFEHPPRAEALARRYQLAYTSPSRCAAEVVGGSADLGLIPVAALGAGLSIVPGCTIASLGRVRSILLLVRLRAAGSLAEVRSVAMDAASRSSVAYTQVLFRHFLGTDPVFLEAPAPAGPQTDPVARLAAADAALVIGDPALLARERRASIEAEHGPCLWIDLAEEWTSRTGLPWVAAVWALREPALARCGISAAELIDDLQTSRDHGLASIDQLVQEWTPRLAVPPDTLRHYLTRNIHYHLDDRCLRAIEHFRRLAAEAQVLPPLDGLHLLGGPGAVATSGAAGRQPG